MNRSDFHIKDYAIPFFPSLYLRIQVVSLRIDPTEDSATYIFFKENIFLNFNNYYYLILLIYR